MAGWPHKIAKLGFPLMPALLAIGHMQSMQPLAVSTYDISHWDAEFILDMQYIVPTCTFAAGNVVAASSQ